MNAHMRDYPAYVFWDVTGDCNHKCFYCYNYWRTGKAGPAVCSEKSFDAIADFIISKKPAAVTLSGGEPLLVFGGIAEQIKRFCAEGICVRIFTNGSLVTEEIADFCQNGERKRRICCTAGRTAWNRRCRTGRTKKRRR